MTKGNMTRKAAIAVAAASLAALSGCSRKSEVDKIADANAAIIEDLDLSSTRLPLGSVVLTSMGRYMIAGHKCATRAEDGSMYGWGYYGVAWPLGIQYPGSEGVAGVLMNVSDIAQVEFVGLVNEEDRDLRAYVDGYDLSAAASAELKTASGMAPVRYSELKTLEQQMRMQGVRSEDLYGESFSGGLLFSEG